MQLVDDGCSRRGNFGSSLVRNMILIYLPDRTIVYSSRGGEFEGAASVQGAEMEALPIHLFRHLL